MTPFVRLIAVLLFAFALPAAAQFQPQVGQAGKDVIWVPTPDDVVERMLTMAQVTPNDSVWDLGAGDGKIAIMAACGGALAWFTMSGLYATRVGGAAGVFGAMVESLRSSGTRDL